MANPTRLAWLAAAFLCVLFLGEVSVQAVELGATVSKNGSVVSGVTFRVWAPNATAVSVVGEWSATASGLAKESGSPWNGIWAGTVSAARPGHTYRYAITSTAGSGILKKDPRGRQVRTMPDGSQVSVVYDKEAFDWEGDNFEPPWPNDIVMYEMHVGTFYDPTPNDGNPATLDDAIQRLDYLKSLGINMIALMPVSEYSGRHSWGYNPTDPFAIEETYGGPDALKRFVKAAHGLGMAVQVDVVHNHYDATSDLVNFDGTANGYFYTTPGLATTPWGPRPRYSDANVRAFLADNIRMWLDEYKIWALRWDSPRNITSYDSNADSEPDTAIPDAVAMMEDIHSMIEARSLRYYSIAEDADMPGGYGGHWEISFHNVVFPRLLGRPLLPPFAERLEYPAINERSETNIGYRLETKQQSGFRVIFSENHDKAGDHNVATDGMRLASDFDAGNPASWTARKKTMLAAALTLTSAGTPMLFMGQEQLAKDGFQDTVALDWQRAAGFSEVVRFHRDLIGLRRNLAGRTLALTYTGLPEFNELTAVTKIAHANETDGVMVYERLTGTASESVLVAVNFSETDKFCAFDFPSAGPWRVHLNSDSKLYGADFNASGPAVGNAITTSGMTNWGSLTIPALSAVVLAKSEPVTAVADLNANGIDDGWEMLFGASDAAGDLDADGFSNLVEFQSGTNPTVADRGSLPGSFNDWNIVSPSLRWDAGRGVWRYVARFLTPGQQECKAYLAGVWSDGANHTFSVDVPGTYEITYNPVSKITTTTRVDTDTTSNGLPDAWEAFYFYPATVANPAADADGDGWTNLQEFERSSDPTVWDYRSMGVVGGVTGWNWAANNMRYEGHGIWTFALAFAQAPTERNFKFGVGPSANDDNWGDTEDNGVGDFKSGTDILWPEGITGWRLVRFNEKTLGYSITPLAGTTDTDGDAMPDAWERYFGLNAFEADSTADLDNDQVRNIFEYARGSRPNDSGDHYAAMAFASGPEWDPEMQKVAMAWNPQTARWEFALFAPRVQSVEFKFAAGTWGNGAWGWNGNGTPGQAVKDATGNISASLSLRGWYFVSFEEFTGSYTIAPLPEDDLDASGVPDAWERAFAISSVSADSDGDGIVNRDEYTRGGHPQFQDHLASLNVVGDLSGWDFSSQPMTWNPRTLRWELLVRATVTTSEQRMKFVAVASAAQQWSNPNWGDSSSPKDGIAESGGSDLPYTVSVAPTYLHFVFDEITLEYAVGPMSLADSGDGLPDAWATYYGVSGGAGNPDADPFTNLQEVARGTNPNVVDHYEQTHALLRVVGSFTGWNPATSSQMTLVGDNLWRLDLLVANTSAQEFKFLAGSAWGDPEFSNGGANIVLPNQGAGTYRFELNASTGAYSVTRGSNSFSGNYPGVTATQIVRGRPALLEYLFGGTLDQAPPTQYLPAHEIVGEKLRLSFVARSDDAALAWRVETTTDLVAGPWTTEGVDSQPEETLSATLVRHIREVPATGAKRFLRLVVESP
jgi:1,4-alpha-glucan branching enzyme